MVKISCPYCSKKYEKARHLQNHIETKHRELIDLMTVPEAVREVIEQEASSVRIPKNPLDMTPEILMRLDLNQQAKWRIDLDFYMKTQVLLNTIFADVGIPRTTPSQTLPPEIEEELKRLDRHEIKDSLMIAIQPLFDEQERRQTTFEKRILDEIKKIEFSLNLLILNDLNKPMTPLPPP